MFMHRFSVVPTRPGLFLWLPVMLTALLASPSHATVLTGAIVDLPEWIPGFTWGDGAHSLYQTWSVYIASEAGYFYGAGHEALSTADVHVSPGLIDPTTITDAESFTYTHDYATASEGDCVFFRGTNGYYGVWRIDAIDPLPGPGAFAKLSGQWYFQDNRTGDFSHGPTAVRGATWGAIKAIYR